MKALFNLLRYWVKFSMRLLRQSICVLTALGISGGTLPNAATAAGAYDMRAMMAQPYPLSLQPPATMFSVPGQPKAAAPNATPTTSPVPAARPLPTVRAPANPLRPGKIDPYSPVTAWGTQAPVRAQPSAVQPAANVVPYRTKTQISDSSSSVKGFWDDGLWRFAFQNEDRGPLDGHFGNSDSGHLTWGWRASYTPDRENPEWFQGIRHWIPWLGNEWRAKASYGMEQLAYAPHTIKADNDLIDRPYAGVLLFNTRVNLSTPFDGGLQQNDNLELGLGVVGDASGAEVIHRVAHSAAGKSSRSWRGGLESEPVFLVQYEKGLRAVYGWDRWFNIEFHPYVGAAAGNMFTYAATGASLRIGSHLKKDAGAPRHRYLMAGEQFPERGKYWFWSLFTGVEQKAVGWNIFTDGNTYRDTSDVTTKPFPYEIITGGEIGYGAYRMVLTHVYRSEEFEEQDGEDRFIRLGLSAHF